MHDASADSVRLCANDDATLTAAFDYRIDVHKLDGERYR